jgi:two-component system, OmpR family, response regulator
LRLLLVEDELILLRSLSQALREEGYAVDEASDGRNGHFKAKAWEYDLIILDWMLPEMSGLELLRQLRKIKSTPVLLLTARDTVQDRVAGLDHGADDYLVKPFELKELLARVRALIRRSTGHATNCIQIGDLQIDIGCKMATLAGVGIPLTAREYALLEMLALNHGKVVTRTMIYDHIFGEEDDSLSNIVDVHVSHLRKKLGRDFIETRRGQGYILHG